MFVQLGIVYPAVYAPFPGLTIKSNKKLGGGGGLMEQKCKNSKNKDSTTKGGITKGRTFKM